MCGLFGATFKLLEDTIKEVGQLMNHRGPDGFGYCIIDNYTAIHRLLAITDLENGNQPIITDKGILTFVGEIFNYPDLKKEFKLRTNCDTELLYHGIAKYGFKEFVAKLQGMYAISYYDRINKKIYLARDRSGIKGIYYAKLLEGYIFCSELKPLLHLGASKDLSSYATKLYLTLGYVPGPATILKRVKKVCPGQIITIDLQNLQLSSEYNLPKLSTGNSNFAEFDFLLEQAVERSMMGVRNIGLLLSGGLDSNLIYFKLKKLGYEPQTFSSRFSNKEFDDDFRGATLSNPNNIPCDIVYKDFLEADEETVSALEEPRFARNTPAYLLTLKQLSQKDITVVLSGDGGDEIFTGYDRHPHIVECYKPRNVFINWIGLNRLNDAFNVNELVDYMKEWFPYDKFGDDHINNMLFVEQMTHLADDFLIRNDKLGMHWSMEARFPLLYDDFKNYVMKMPGTFKMNKVFLREWYKDLLPPYVITKKKSGWSIPFKDWYSTTYYANRFVKARSWFNNTFNFTEQERTMMNNSKTNISLYHLHLWCRDIGIL